jgi:hypothetical protein
MRLKCLDCGDLFLKLHPRAGLCFECYQQMKRTIPHRPEDYI